MLGFDPLFFSGSVESPTYRYLRLSWNAGGGANLGFTDVRFYANGVAYPPPMTSNTAPWPYVASAASVYNGAEQPPYLAFDGATTEYVQAGSGAGWLKLDCGAGFGISPDRVDLRPRMGGGGSPESPINTLTLAGSNDDVTYETLATISVSSWAAGVTQSFATGRAGGGLAVKTVTVSQPRVTQSYTVPAGLSLLILKLWGAGGGASGSGATRYGGAGGYQYVEVPVMPGDVITYAAGGRGENSGETNNGGTSGSGQGSGGKAGPLAGTGGGRTEVYKNGVLIAVAPGGGGAGGSDGWGGQGGVGGGLTGGAAPDSNDSIGGKGGTQAAGGAAGSPGAGATAGSGGNGGVGATSGSSNGGGGGGGGLFGGGGGGAASGGQDAGGGGGSAYAHPTLTRNAVTLSGSGFTPPNMSDPMWTSSAGIGGGAADGPGYGLVVLAAA